VTKHHQAYVDYANKNVPGSIYENSTIEEIIRKASGPLFNNVAQVYNHNFFWQGLTDKKVAIPTAVAQFLAKNFGTVEDFKSQFVSKASAIFGSGWAYLTRNANGTISINQYSNAFNPIRDSGYPILAVDTWEHSWYIDYKNRKAEYFSAFWGAANWTFVAERIAQAPK
jgi:Fe-Mn family superoxide dismutase